MTVSPLRLANQIRFNLVDSKSLGPTRVYNLSAFSVSPDSLFKALKKRFPNFSVKYSLDFRNEIAKAWPSSMNCDRLFKLLDYQPEFSFEESLDTTIDEIKQRLSLHK